MRKQFFVQIVGLNAGASLALAADQEGKLRELLSRGVLWLDEKPVGSAGTIGRNGIISNSPVGDYLQVITPNGYFASVLETEIGRWFRAQDPMSQVPLAKVGELQGAIQLRLAEIIQNDFPESDIRQARVRQGIWDDVEGFKLFSQNEKHLTQSLKLVLAPGAREKVLPELANLASGDNFYLSSQVIADGNYGGLWVDQRKVHVLGVSHSAAAVIATFERQQGCGMHARDVVLWGRRPMKYFYNSVADAERDRYSLSEGDVVCPETGRVNRWDGVRPPYREQVQLYSGLLEEKKFGSLAELLPQIVEPDTAIVQALGYKANLIPLWGPATRIGPKVNERSHVVVDAQYRIFYSSLARDPDAIPGAFALGLGHMPTHNGSPHDGMNTYVTEAAPVILRGLGL